MAKILPLRGMIFAKFESEAQMADAIGWPRQRLNKITNGIKEPTLEEVDAIAKAVGEEFMTVAAIFLEKKSPSEQHYVRKQ